MGSPISGKSIREVFVIGVPVVGLGLHVVKMGLGLWGQTPGEA